MKNAEQLRETLATVVADLVSGKMTPAVASEIANASGKMIQSAKVQLEYHDMKRRTKNMPVIAFLESA